MLTTIFMPKASMSMAEGTLIRWLKQEGDPIEAGEAVVEIETDKTAMEVESEVGGVLLKKIHAEGDVVPVTTVLGYIGGGMEELKDIPAAPAAQTAVKVPEQAEKAAPFTPAQTAVSGKTPASPAAKVLAGERGIALDGVKGRGPGGAVLRADVASALERATGEARSLANGLSVDVETLYEETGVLVRSEEVRHAAEGKKSFTTLSLLPSGGQDQTVELSGMRRTIARRMAQSHTEVPPVTMSAAVNVTPLLRMRAQINEETGQKLSINDFILRAAALALKRNPYMNASYGGDKIILYGSVHMGMAVAVEKGLIVPVIRDCDRLSVAEISACAKELASKAREGKLAPAECEGGTFTVSNLSMFGVTSFTPIINLPQAAILGVCAVRKTFALDEKGEGRFIDEMELCATFDHRVVDGALCAKFLSALKELLENPFRLLV